MRLNYRRIGDCIKVIDERNTDLKVTNLIGISISKEVIPSVANTVGTDMSKYKIIRKNQFACSTMQVRRDKKMPVALLKNANEAIISAAYPVFEVVDENLILPEYLMMWFSRTEFDREACFYAIGGVRGSIEWEDFCNMQLPVPSIQKQREIVKEYNVLQDRIGLNNTLIEKLEEAAQAIYKQWFIDFEFPDENGNPYKSTGGDMVFNEELDKEIPEKWNVSKLSHFCEITSGKRIFESEYKTEGIPFYRGGEIIQKKQGVPIKNSLYISEERYNEIIEVTGKPNSGDILLTAVGSLGISYLVSDENFYFKDGNLIWLKNFRNQDNNLYIYDYFQSIDFRNMITEITIGSTQSAITIKSLSEQKIVEPSKDILKMYKEISSVLSTCIQSHKDINMKIVDLIEILLAKLAVVEG